MSVLRTVYLLRHAATGREDVWLGQRDDSLSDTGLGQARGLAQVLRDSRADAIFCSDLTRARETAESIAAPLRLAPVLLPGLRERDFGAWEGLTWADISTRFPLEAAAYVGDWLRVAPPGAETVEDMRRRVLAAWAQIAAGSWTRAIVVGHGGTNRILLAELLGMPRSHLFRIAQDPAALNRIELFDEIPCVRALNRQLDSSNELP